MRSLPNSELTAIGFARTPWSRGDCPKNMARARERDGAARLDIDPAFRTGLKGLNEFEFIVLLGWFGPATERVPLIQHPSHLAEPRGVFALRSPLRPNPIALSIARISAFDEVSGVIGLDALDWFDGTPLLDIKPFYASTDAPPGAAVVPVAADLAAITLDDTARSRQEMTGLTIAPRGHEK